MVGIGAILQPTHDPEAHWSEPNQITLVTESEDPASDGSADLELDATAVPAGPPAKPPLVGRRPPQV